MDEKEKARELADQIVTDYGDADYWKETDDEPVDAIQGIEMALREAQRNALGDLRTAMYREIQRVEREEDVDLTELVKRMPKASDVLDREEDPNMDETEQIQETQRLVNKARNALAEAYNAIAPVDRTSWPVLDHITEAAEELEKARIELDNCIGFLETSKDQETPDDA